MPERRGPVRRLAGLFAGRARGSAIVREARVIAGWNALRALERSWCDDVCDARDDVAAGVGARTLARAAGLALTGRRVAAFAAPDESADAGRVLRFAVERRVPLVVHAPLDASWLDGCLDSGAIVATARSAQRAADLAPVLRLAAEEALVPAVLLVDRREIADGAQDVAPPPDSVRDALGRADEEIDAPTAEQRMLLGERRRRVPRWFDPSRPALHGAAIPPAIDEAAGIGRHAFVAAEREVALARAAARLGLGDAVPLEVLARGKDEAVVVACGATLEVVAAAAATFGRRRPTVIDATVLDPLPAAVVRAVIGDAARVVVVERCAADRAGRLAARLGRAVDPARIVSLTFDRSDGATLRAALERAVAADAPPMLHARSVPDGERPGFPRLDSLRQRVHREYPEAESGAIPAGATTLSTRPAGAVALTVIGDAAVDLADTIDRALEPLSSRFGGRARGRLAPFGDDGTRADLVLAREHVDAAALDGIPDATVADSAATLRRAAGAPAPRDGGVIAVAGAVDGPTLWADLPPAWRRAVRDRELRLLAVDGDVDAAISAAALALDGDAAAPAAVDVAAMIDPAAPTESGRLPLVTRRFGDSGTTYDNVARFWGEFDGPLDGGEAGVTVDPYVTLGAVPPCTSTFRDRAAERDRMPTIDPAMCTGCGTCWATCPDSAIAPVALGTEAWLDAAADLAGDGGDAAGAGALRRVHRQLAARIDSDLARDGGRRVGTEELRRGFDWLIEKMKPSADERAGIEAAFERTLAAVRDLPLAATDVFLHEAQREQKGSGTLLMLAINPQSCQACGLCAAVCPDEAIVIGRQDAERIDRARREWRAWEALPDTAGATIARAMRHPRVGGLAAVLMSRHCLFAMAGGDSAEPGSGERIAVRQTTAVLEYRGQQRILEQARRMAELADGLRGAIGGLMAQATEVADLDALRAALAGQPDADAAALLARLEALEGPRRVDVTRLRRMADAAAELERRRAELVEGAQGTGAARFGLLVASPALAEELARFPRNPFSVPAVVDGTGDPVGLAAGLVESSRAACVESARVMRRGELLTAAPADLPARLRELEQLDWDGLDDEERARVTPLLVLATENERARALELLERELPVVVLLLDGRDPRDGGVDATLAALARREAYVAATAISHPAHLFDSVGGAVDCGAAALLHVHAPSPRRHGFATNATVERARGAIDARVHPLLRYDPRADGVFGLRIDLDGNPRPDAAWAEGEDGAGLTPARWAVGERRFAGSFGDGASVGGGIPVEQWIEIPPGDRASRIPTVPGPNGRSAIVGGDVARAVGRCAERWAVLRELAGLVTPFTERVRAEAEDALRQAHRAELDALRAEYEGQLAALRAAQREETAARLRQRLMQLAGYGAPPRSS